MLFNVIEQSTQRFALPACGRGVDSAWEQEKLEARILLAIGAAESHTLGAHRRMRTSFFTKGAEKLFLRKLC